MIFLAGQDTGFIIDLQYRRSEMITQNEAPTLDRRIVVALCPSVDLGSAVHIAHEVQGFSLERHRTPIARVLPLDLTTTEVKPLTAPCRRLARRGRQLCHFAHSLTTGVIEVIGGFRSALIDYLAAGTS